MMQRPQAQPHPFLLPQVPCRHSSVVRLCQSFILSGQPGLTPDGRAAVAHLHNLHGLPLAAVWYREELKVVSHGGNVHKKVSGICAYPAAPVQLYQLAVFYPVDFLGGYPEILPGFADGGYAIVDHVVAVLHLCNDILRVSIPCGNHGVCHPYQRHVLTLGCTHGAVRLHTHYVCALPAVHKTFKYTFINEYHPLEGTPSESYL